VLVCALLVVLPLALAPIFAALAAFLPLELEVLEVSAPPVAVVVVVEPPPVPVARVARVAPAPVARVPAPSLAALRAVVAARPGVTILPAC
jgi:hypothetical protein